MCNVLFLKLFSFIIMSFLAACLHQQLNTLGIITIITHQIIVVTCYFQSAKEISGRDERGLAT